MFIDGSWAPQIGNWLIRRFVLHSELHSKVSGARVGCVLIYVCFYAVMPSHSADWMGAPKSKVQGMP